MSRNAAILQCVAVNSQYDTRHHSVSPASALASSRSAAFIGWRATGFPHFFWHTFTDPRFPHSDLGEKVIAYRAVDGTLNANDC